MSAKRHKPGLAHAARFAQGLAGPADGIMGSLTLLLEDVRRGGPPGALEDLERVAEAARRLGGVIARLGPEPDGGAPGGQPQARMQHDLRTPINAILGYCEMVLEEFGAGMSGSVRSDIQSVMNQARRISAQVDMLADEDSSESAGGGGEAEDGALAASLAQSLSDGAHTGKAQTGHILVVDDELVNRDILTRQLTRQGHSVQAAASAAETFEALARAPFDLVLLDILMPGVNGIEVLQRIRANPAWRDMPVVMISGLKDTDAIVKCIAAGAEDYLPKPIDPLLLHARVDACLERLTWRKREQDFTRRIEYEKERANALLHAMLPALVIQRLNDGETQIADRFDSATILFADIVDFTPLVARTDPVRLLQGLARVFSAFDDLATRHGVEKIKTIGDAYMAAAGIPVHRSDHALAVVEFARDMMRTMAEAPGDGPGFRLRVGIHTGPVIAGLIGKKRSVYDVWGETVNLASRLETSGRPDRIHVSAATRSAIGDKAGAAEAHEHEVKGIGRITSYFIR